MVPEIYNIFVEWSKETGSKNFGVSVNKEEKEHENLYSYTIHTDAPGLLIGNKGCTINKYIEKLLSFLRELNPNKTISVKIYFNEVDMIIGKNKIDVDVYYSNILRRF